jgi:hypothetical protein
MIVLRLRVRAKAFYSRGEGDINRKIVNRSNNKVPSCNINKMPSM